MTDDAIKIKLDQAIAVHQGGNYTMAEGLYLAILEENPQHFDALHLLGVVHAQIGQYPHAITFMQRALAISQDHAALYTNLGAALCANQQTVEALACYQHALILKPNCHNTHFNCANLLHKQGQLEQAVTHYECAIRLNIDYVDAYFNCANVLQELGHIAQALSYYDQTISLSPQHIDAHFNRSNLLQDTQQFSQAIEGYNLVISLNNQYVDAYLNRGTALQSLGKLEEAIASYNQAIAIDSHCVSAYLNRGLAQQERQCLVEALYDYQSALQLNPQYAEAYFCQGNAYKDMQQPDLAIASYQQAVQLRIAYAEAYYNLGVIHSEQQQLDTAIQYYDIALQYKENFTDALWNKCIALLSQGKYKAGWQQYEKRWQRSGMRMSERTFKQPLWLGQFPLDDKTLLLHHEQGFGDTLQFCRYATLIAQAHPTSKILLEVPEELITILDALPVTVIRRGNTLPHFDYHCPLMSLPLACQTFNETDIPANIPYLYAQSDKVAYWQSRLGNKSKPRIGLVWSGGFMKHFPEQHLISKRRNIPFSQIATLAELDCDFYSLQKGEIAELELHTDKPRYWHKDNLHILTDKLYDFSDTAALIVNLDLIIAVDTAVAHLAGALGKPVWLLNRFDTCWRWLLHRQDTPWYPNMTIYRQPVPKDWHTPLTQLKKDLNTYLSRESLT